MNISDTLALPLLAGARVVAGEAGLGREVRWVHVVDIPDPASWVRRGQLLPTTGYAWPRQEEVQRRLMRTLAEQGLAGVAMAVPHFFEHFPRVAMEEADQAGLPLIEIPWEVPFGEITEAVHRALMAEHYRVIEQSEAIHRAMTGAAIEADSLQDLATVLGRLIHRAVTIEDSDGHVLAAHSLASMEDEVRRSSAERGRTPTSYLTQLSERGDLERIKRSTQPVRVPALPVDGADERAVCPIRLKGELVGFVWIIEGGEPLSELHLRAAEHAALICALHIARQRELASVETRLGHTFLDSLLAGQFDRQPHTLERATLLGFDLEGEYRVGLVVLNESVPLSRDAFLRRDLVADRLRRRLQDQGAPPLVSLSLNQIFALLPAHIRPDLLWPQTDPRPGAFLLGRVHPGIEGVRRSYLEALSLAPHAHETGIYHYDDLLLPRLLTGDEAAREEFLDDLFGELRKLAGGEVIEHSLLILAEHGFHQLRAAEALNVHPNTLRYRLRRAEDRAGFNLGDSETRFRLQLAGHLLSLHDKVKP